MWEVLLGTRVLSAAVDGRVEGDALHHALLDACQVVLLALGEVLHALHQRHLRVGLLGLLGLLGRLGLLGTLLGELVESFMSREALHKENMNVCVLVYVFVVALAGIGARLEGALAHLLLGPSCLELQDLPLLVLALPVQAVVDLLAGATLAAPRQRDRPGLEGAPLGEAVLAHDLVQLEALAARTGLAVQPLEGLGVGGCAGPTALLGVGREDALT